MGDDLDDARTMTEVGTKLDLARAYVDMGDPGGARSILEEVLDEGDDAQRQQAQSLLDSLYMTVITLTTVGFKEVFPLGRDGQILTIFVILVGYVALSIALANKIARIVWAVWPMSGSILCRAAIR